MTENSSTLFQISTTAGWLDRFAHMNVARRISEGKCSTCGRLLTRVPSPFEIKRSYDRWSPNLGRIPDFSPVGMFTVISEAGKEALASLSNTLEFGAVVVVENSDRRKGFGKRGASRFAEEVARDQGLPLWRLKVKTCYAMDLERSGRTVERRCPACGFVRYAVTGDGRILVDPSEWRGEDIFKLVGCSCNLLPEDEFFGPIFVTVRARDILLPLNLSNLYLREVGYIGSR